MPNLVAEHRISPLTAEQHKQVIVEALESQTMNPYELGWHYLNMVFKTKSCQLSETARTLGIPRRTVQRVLTKRRIL